jgi:probable F420-dependent oxidoreductase
MTARLGGTGICSSARRYGECGRAPAAATELEDLGYAALWIPDAGGDLFGPVANLLRATSTATVATGVLNVWMHTPEETAAQHAALTGAHGPRFLCGMGISNRQMVELAKPPGTFQQPIATMTEYLDRLDDAEVPLAAENRMLAALGPKMLELARTRTAGTLPYLVTPELTARARSALGPDALVASEQGVVLEMDPARARATARLHLDMYLGLPNYSSAWKRQGFDEHDLADGGSDRLVDALVVWGDEETIAGRIKAHRDAGADHVCIQVLTEDPRMLPTEQWRALSPALTA